MSPLIAVPEAHMQGKSLKTRYILTVLVVGILLTASVALALYFKGRLTLVIGVGLALSLLAAGITAALLARIDRAMIAMITGADRIGRGRHTEPLPRSGVPEMRALEDALDRMREELTRTTISRDYLETLLNSMGDAVLVASTDGYIRTTNAAAQRLFDRTPGELEGVDFGSLIAPEHLAAFSVAKILEAPGETVVRTGRGQTIPVAVSASAISSADPGFHGHIFVLRDITDRKRAERRIRYLARFDALTKIPNRMQLQHLLQQAIARATRQGRGLVLLYIDLDNFKDINDTFGHESGDRILETISERLSRALPREVGGRPAGGRRVRDLRRGRGRRGGTPRAGEFARAAGAGRDRAPAAHRRPRDGDHGQHRHRDLPGARGQRHRSDPQRGCGDVPRQAGRP